LTVVHIFASSADRTATFYSSNELRNVVLVFPDVSSSRSIVQGELVKYYILLQEDEVIMDIINVIVTCGVLVKFLF